MNSAVIEFLREKFPEVNDDEIFRTDYAGDIHENILNENAIENEIECEKACNACDGNCSLPENVKNSQSRIVMKICENPNGKKFFDVRRTCGLCCKFDALKGEFGRLYKASGLILDDLKKNFSTYQCGDNSNLRVALREAFMASKTGECLIIGGKRGTGKTHLAIAIANEAMKAGKTAKVRLVSALLDELREAVLKNDNYFQVIGDFKGVDCLVLDDLGKEKSTEAAAAYLHQIMDYRYRHCLQTIITTNAISSEELCTWSGVDFVAPIVSRMLERGQWVNITNAADFRIKKNH